MTDPLTTTANNFSTTFIFQIQAAYDFGISNTGPGLAFIIVPDNTTIGAIDDYMGLLTANTTETTENYLSDSHTVGVELDTFQNQQFNDPYNNHICIDVASMNSTWTNTFIPSILLTTSNAGLYQQVWIDYFQANSEMFIYHTQYPSSKPAIPLGSMAGVDLSILNEYMYVGFSSSSELATNKRPTIMAWSFSSEGEAPPIKIGKDAGAPTSPSPPPPPTPSSGSPPASRSAPPPNTTPPSGPVPAPASPPSPSSPPPIVPSPPPPIVPSPPPPIVPSPPPPIVPSPPPPIVSPSKSPTSPPLAPVKSNPPPPGPVPNAPSPVPSPSSPPPASSGSPHVKAIVGAVIGVIIIVPLLVGMIFYCRWESSRRPERISSEAGRSNQEKRVAYPPDPDPRMIPAPTLDRAPIVPAGRKLHIFISHTGGPDGSLKNFPIYLYEQLRELPFFEVFIDRFELPKGTPFPEELMHAMQKIDALGMGVGIMVVTKEFFKKRWPLIELLKFLDMQNKHGCLKIRVLPLFYLKSEEIRSLLERRFWEEEWASNSTPNHRIDVGKCEDAVAKLCILNGVVYNYTDLGHNTEYTKEILECLNKMYNEIMTTFDNMSY